MPLRHLWLLWTCCPGSNGTAAQTKPVWIKVYPKACGRLKSQVEEHTGLSKKEFCGHQTRCCVWQKPNTTHICKHATPSWSIMMWGCFSAAGPGRLLKVEDKREILEDIQTQSARELLLCRRSVSHQVSHLKHTAKATWKWFKDKVNVESKLRFQSDREFVAVFEKGCSCLTERYIFSVLMFFPGHQRQLHYETAVWTFPGKIVES